VDNKRNPTLEVSDGLGICAILSLLCWSFSISSGGNSKSCKDNGDTVDLVLNDEISVSLI
jgi:hypothetical protein